MLIAGISILDIVESLLEDSKGAQRLILQTLKEDINQGLPMYKSFEKFPRVFDKVTTNIVKAAEEAGNLDTVLKDLRENIKRDQEFIDKVRAAFVYPVIIFIVFFGVLILMLTFVVPRISTVFLRLKVELPLPTKIMLFMSDLVLHQTVWLVGGLVVIIAAVIIFYRANRQMFFNFLFSMPLVSGLINSIDLARFTRSMYLLLSSGIPIVGALELAGGVMIKRSMQQVAKKAQSTVLEGKPMSLALKSERKLIPRMMVKITEAGERSGTLDKSMQDVSEYMDHEVSTTLATITTIIEPLMLVVVGIFIGGMMLAIIAPIYGLIGSVGQQ